MCLVRRGNLPPPGLVLAQSGVPPRQAYRILPRRDFCAFPAPNLQGACPLVPSGGELFAFFSKSARRFARTLRAAGLPHRRLSGLRQALSRGFFALLKESETVRGPDWAAIFGGTWRHSRQSASAKETTPRSVPFAGDKTCVYGGSIPPQSVRCHGAGMRLRGGSGSRYPGHALSASGRRSAALSC